MVEWTDPAKQDLKSLHDYIAKDSKLYANKVSFELVEKTENLNLFPEIGRIVPEIGDTKIRELIIYSYRLIYEIHSDKIAILALVHGKRDFTKIDLDDRR